MPPQLRLDSVPLLAPFAGAFADAPHSSLQAMLSMAFIITLAQHRRAVSATVHT